ncbi:MAG: NAD-dependent epimerase/dehydratase family protein [Alphaproteobacteria bacterium]|nr:NAD-dependent epimerase/dehydratase family protein [Alphaproteobacteria bacterium]MBU1525466.1 NAD-dependent epimerase/dehydratase family protein [Alphaproteobacteria bacterium]MBU2116322.1 NAD-dependent epimerase/dehydratase family protein [Alphaproteobacteria bacterium]MBU2350868.1 NAD-dependent epimerase/dehydratase family protein [Alphaproteobacteria bacterium]MBU2381751.1 NAD-dependent epimerase/dehydratase family protein [Alphaproteobacteria bacterium]
MARRPILVTGSAGFIGFHVARALLERGQNVVGLDNLNAYYDPRLKAARRERLLDHPNYVDNVLDLADRPRMAELFEHHRPVRVVHMGAQAGIRYSVENPETYVDANVVGFLNVLQGCQRVGTEHLVFASTSSVYGANGALPFDTGQAVSHPLNLYSATKIANEAMAHAFAYVHGLPCTGLRFFTVYGPWGRPDMALFKFTRAIVEGTPIDVYGEGLMERDFTYVDDIVDGVLAALDDVARPDPAWRADAPDPATSGVAPWRVFNLGAGRREPLSRYIGLIEAGLGKKAIMNLLPAQPGEMLRTEADIVRTRHQIGYEPRTAIDVGVGRFVSWYRDFYGV